MKLYNDTERFDGAFQIKDIDDSQEYGYSEVLQKIYNDLYTNGGEFKGIKGDPGTPGKDGLNATNISIINKTYVEPLDASELTTPANSTSLNIITIGSDEYFLILTNNTDSDKVDEWQTVKDSAVKISGKSGSDGFDGLPGADSTVPGPPAQDGKDGISWQTIPMQFDTVDNQIVVQPYTTIIVFIKSTGSVATYTNTTDTAITTNTNVFVYISLKGDKGDSIKGDIGPKGDPSDVMNRAYFNNTFSEVITVTAKTILLITAKYTDTSGPHTMFGVYTNNTNSPIDVTANLSNTDFNWNDLQGSKGLDSTVQGPKGDPGVGIKGDKGDPGQITDTVVLNLTKPNSSDTININAFTLAFVFKITDQDKLLAIYNNNTSQSQTPTVGSLTFTSLLGKQGIPGQPGQPGADSTVPGPASKIVTAFINNPTDSTTVSTPPNTTTIVYVTVTNSSGMVLSKMGSITNNSSNYITTKYSDINLTQVSSEQVIPEPGKNANVKTVTFNDLDTTKTFAADARTAYIITNVVTATSTVYIGTISNDTDASADLSYSNVTFNRISGKDGKDGKDAVAEGNIEFIEGDSTASILVPAKTKIQVFDSTANVIAVYVNDTDEEVTKAANFTFKPKGGGENPDSAAPWVFDKPYNDSFWYQNFLVNGFSLNDKLQNPIKSPQLVAPVIFSDTNAINAIRQDKIDYKYTPTINKLTYLDKSSNIYSMTYNASSYSRSLTSSLLFNEFDNTGIDGKIVYSPVILSQFQNSATSGTRYNLRHNPNETFAFITDPVSSSFTKYAAPILHLGGQEDKVLTSKDLASLNTKLNLTNNLETLNSGNYLKWLSGDTTTTVGNEFLVVLADRDLSNNYTLELPFTSDRTPFTGGNDEVAYIVIQKISDTEYYVNGYYLFYSFNMPGTINKNYFDDQLMIRWHVTSDIPIVWETGNYQPGGDTSSLHLYVNSLAMSSAYSGGSSNHTLTIVKQTTTAPQAISYPSQNRPYSDARFFSNLAGWPVYSSEDAPLSYSAQVDVPGSLAKLNKMYSDNWTSGSDFVTEVSNGSWIKSANLGVTAVQGSLGNPYLIPWKFNISDQRAQS